MKTANYSYHYAYIAIILMLVTFVWVIGSVHLMRHCDHLQEQLTE